MRSLSSAPRSASRPGEMKMCCSFCCASFVELSDLTGDAGRFDFDMYSCTDISNWAVLSCPMARASTIALLPRRFTLTRNSIADCECLYRKA